MNCHEYYELWKFDEELGRGIDRVAYYSHEYNLVVKRPHSYNGDSQTANEKKVWDAMTGEERTVFPVVKFFKAHGEWCVVMPRVTTFKSRGFLFGNDAVQNPTRFKRYCAAVGANPRNLDLIVRVQRKFNLDDLHCANLGWMENGDLVIIDVGL